VEFTEGCGEMATVYNVLFQKISVLAFSAVFLISAGIRNPQEKFCVFRRGYINSKVLEIVGYALDAPTDVRGRSHCDKSFETSLPMGEGDVLEDKRLTKICKPSTCKPKSQQIALRTERVEFIIDIEKTIGDI
jgi:hypothetical protein